MRNVGRSAHSLCAWYMSSWADSSPSCFQGAVPKGFFKVMLFRLNENAKTAWITNALVFSDVSIKYHNFLTVNFPNFLLKILAREKNQRLISFNFPGTINRLLTHQQICAKGAFIVRAATSAQSCHQ